MKNMQPAVSVVIPVYNLERYVDLCLKSVRRQTFADFEAIVVDDGSTDGSWDAIRRHADADPRFVPIRTENRGVARARERALSEARGTWIAFLDGDDIWEPDMLERLVEASEGCDIVSCDYKHITGSYEKRVRTRGRENMQGPEFLEATLCCAMPVALWARLYRRELFAGLHHYPVRLGQDMLLNIEIGCRCPRLRHVDYAGYGYVQRAGSSIRRKPDFDYCCDFAAKVEAILSAPEAGFGDRAEYLRLLNAVWWYAGYVSRSSNPWKGDTSFAAWVRGGVVRYRRELRTCHAPVRLLLIRMDRRRWLRPAVVALATVLRWKESLGRRLAALVQ